MLEKKLLGRFGEQIAKQYLEEHGYKILDQNYYTRYGEIDLICEKNKVIVFVEVKTRTSSVYGFPEEAVVRKKIKNLTAAGNKYMINKNNHWQIDVVAIILSEKHGAKINHLKNCSLDY